MVHIKTGGAVGVQVQSRGHSRRCFADTGSLKVHLSREAQGSGSKHALKPLRSKVWVPRVGLADHQCWSHIISTSEVRLSVCIMRQDRREC